MKTSVLIVDDHRLVRMGLVALLASDPRFQVVGEADSVASAIEAARQFMPDVVVLDVRLPDGSGVEACREIRSHRPETHVVMLTSYSDEEAIISSIVAGASGFLLKLSDPDQVTSAIISASENRSSLDTLAADAILRWVRRVAFDGVEDPLTSLSEQERLILPLIADGFTNREIASRLFLSEHTVKTYISHILQKLNLRRRSEAASFITRHRRSFRTGT